MTIRLDPAASLAQSGILEGSATAMQAVISAAIPALTTPLPAGSEEVSTAAAGAFSAHGAGAASSAGLGQLGLGSSAAALAVNATDFVAQDVANASDVAASVNAP
jgi:hypothetical protein